MREIPAAGQSERYQVIVIGGGQAGLSVGYHLARQGVSFVILEGNRRVGDSWRQRWDSLRLFSPARYDGLSGMRFPAGRATFPTKDEMAQYLEAYAERFELPVRTGVRVDRLSRWNGRFVVQSGDRRFEADQVVVAMGPYQRPRVPEFAAFLDAGIVQLHSSRYRGPSQLKAGPVLVVGAGNSGSEIAMEVVSTHPTLLAGPEVPVVPFRNDSFAGRFLLVDLIRFVGHHILTVDTPIGRKARPALLHGATPLIRVKPRDLLARGVERVGRVVGVRDGRPELDDHRLLDVGNVIWSTGYHPGFSWIDLPIFSPEGDPLHERGIVAQVPGLYFVGLHFQYSMTSDLVNGVSRDAERVVDSLARRRSA